MDSFLDAERLGTAQRNVQEFNLELNEYKACDLDWLVIGCNFTGSYDKYAYANFTESNSITCGSSEPNAMTIITDGSSHLQSGLLTNLVLTLSMSYFLMK